MGGGHRLLATENDQGVDFAEIFNVAGGRLENVALLGALAFENGLNAQARLNARFSPQVSHRADGVKHQGKLVFEAIVDQVGEGRGVGLHRQKLVVAHLAEGVPQLFGNVGHKWVQQLENAVEHKSQGLLGHPLGGAIALQARLDQLDVPVAKVAPGKLVQLLGGFA